MSLKFTDAQKKAIQHTETSVLVSAGAGSGKTAVLSERVIAHLKRGVPLDALVILTFTNAAAKEMKQRIRKRLVAEADHPLMHQALTMIDTAAIQTFDSYALTIVRKFGYLKNLSNQVQVGDKAELAMVKNELIDTLFLEYYKAKDKRFLNFVTRYEIKDDQLLKTMLYDFYQSLTMHDDFLELLERYKNDDLETLFDTFFSRYQTMIFEVIEALQTTCQNALEEVSEEESIAYIDAHLKMFSTLFNAGNYEACYEAVQAIDRLPTLNRASHALRKKENLEELALLNHYKDEIKKLYGELKDSYLAKTISQHQSDFFASRKDYPLLIEMIETLDQRYQDWAFSHEKMDFSMIARLALMLVKEEPKVQETLRSQLEEIMVDEYQDTNRLQESFINRLGAKRIYSVGDIKQSIYRFRHAEPQLFMERYHRYQAGSGSVIALNLNFRSRAKILQGINQLFRRIMDEPIGGVDYTNDQELKYGNHAYDDAVEPNYPQGLTIALYDTEEPEVQQYLTSNQLDESLMEIFYLAKTIKNEVGQRRVYDAKTKRLRLSQYNDYAILISVSKRFDEIRKIFEYCGVPLAIHRDESLMEYYDVDLYRNTLRWLYALQDRDYYERHGKHVFMSVARSYAFSFTDEAIVKQSYRMPKSLETFESTVTVDFVDFFTRFKSYATRTKYEPIDRVFRDVVNDFQYYEALTKVPDTQMAKSRLDHVVKTINRFSQEHKLLGDIVRYFDRIRFDELEVSFDASSKTMGNHVQLMTIHKSKGLEFPIVFLPNLHRGFNRGNQKSYAFDRDLGFILSHDDEGLQKSFIYDMYKQQERKNDISERIRVLYVALTRAKEACVIPLINTSKHRFRYNAQHKVIDYDRIYHFNSYHAMIYAVLPFLKDAQTTIHLADYNLSDQFKYVAYVHEPDDPKIPRKSYHKSDYQTVVRQSHSFSSGIKELMTLEQFKAIEYGQRLHEVFELIRFDQPLENQMRTMALDAATEKIVRAFFESQLMQSLSIINAYSEFPFTVLDEDQDVQGYIDLLLECDDRWVIIDYKLKAIDKVEYSEQIKGYVSILKSLSDKPVEGYLYSFMDQKFKPII